jgi:two-component system OmpR family sensor kinase
MKRSSIALRLALGLSVGTALLWIGAATISGIVMRHELGEAFDETLRQSAFRLLPLAAHAAREPDGHRSHEVEGLAEGEEYVTYFVRDRAGNLVVQALDAPKELSGVKVPDGFSTIDGRRIFATTDPRMGYRITVIELNNHRD